MFIVWVFCGCIVCEFVIVVLIILIVIIVVWMSVFGGIVLE